jgi:hypothetical protein
MPPTDAAPDDPRDGMPPDWRERDAIESYNVAVRAIGEQVKAGAPTPASMLSRKVGEVTAARAREWITRPVAERETLEAAGWRFHTRTVRPRPGKRAEHVVVMWRDRAPELFAGAEG